VSIEQKDAARFDNAVLLLDHVRHRRAAMFLASFILAMKIWLMASLVPQRILAMN
jgi:hypothetical protein